jgi:lipid-A-disaccharide synthase
VKYYVIAGEASGDLHGSNLLKHIKLKDASADFRCWGGDLMQAQGAFIVKHYKELAFMGFLEVVKNIRTILKNITFCKQDILTYKPDVLVLIDYPGFNLRIAEFAHAQGIKVVYYISPQVWAWKQSRVYKIKNCVDKMITILPFEKAFYEQFDYPVVYVGHPLIDAISDFKKQPASSTSDFRSAYKLSEKPIIALLPGSRLQEIKKMLPVMLKAAMMQNDCQIVVAAATSQPDELYRQLIGKNANVVVVKNQTYALLHHAHVALVTSGTATLETALFGVPQAVCYKGGRLSYLIARKLIKVKYISLVNLIMDAPVVKELIQDDMNEKELNLHLKQLLADDNRQTIIANYKKLATLLGGEGASAKAAQCVAETIQLG